MPQVKNILSQADGLISQGDEIVLQATGVMEQMETVLTNLEVVTDQLAGMDLGSMVENVDALVTTSQAGVEQAMKQSQEIDFNTLNKAIKDLADVVEPLAKFFNVFH